MNKSFPHPPRTADLAPSDFLFLNLKSDLAQMRIIPETEACSEDLDFSYYLEGMKKFKSRCVDNKMNTHFRNKISFSWLGQEVFILPSYTFLQSF